MCVVQISQQRGTELYHECYILTLQTTQAYSTALPGDKTLVEFNLKKIILDHSLMINYSNKTTSAYKDTCVYYTIDVLNLLHVSATWP